MAALSVGGLLPIVGSEVDRTPTPAVLPHTHPWLLVNDREVGAALEAAKTDPLRAELHRKIIAAATADLSARIPVYQFSGPRLQFDTPGGYEPLLTCAMAYRLTGDVRFAERAKAQMLAIAGFKDWDPAVFLDVAELGFEVGIGYDWLYSYLTPTERTVIRQALLEKALGFAQDAYRPGGPRDPHLAQWVSANSSWNTICNGGLLTAALALADEEPELARLVASGVRLSLPSGMNTYQPDGACPEGPGYWNYGTTYAVVSLAEFKEAFGTDLGLDQLPAFDRTPLYRLAVQGPTGLPFNYGDGDDKMANSPAYAWLASRYDLPAATSECRRFLAEEFRQTWKFFPARDLALFVAWFPTRELVGAIESIPLALHFRGRADIAVFRSAWDDPKAIYLGFKAGDNSAPHSHLDLGSFVLDADGVRWAVLFPHDDYNLPGYFGKERWKYYRNNNHSQNTLTPGDKLQGVNSVAPIIAFGSSEDRAFAVADLTQAYPEEGPSIRRGVALLDRCRVSQGTPLSVPAGDGVKVYHP
jgi:hypothetical protein